MNKKGIIVLFVTLFLSLLLVSVVFALTRADADRLNFYGGEIITITMYNEEATAGDFNATLPALFTYLAGCPPFSGGQDINCIAVPPGGTATFTIKAPIGTYNEFDVATMTTVQNTTGSFVSLPNVKFIKLQDYRIFTTLVEYGRGRGNYFFSSAGNQNRSGTGRSGEGCAFLPNGTEFELNYLHKLYNIKQFYGSATQSAGNATFHCEYPDDPVVREHLVSEILKEGGLWKVNYSILEIEGDWERMGYIGMHIGPSDYAAGDNITVNCTGISYQYPPDGNISIDSDSFVLFIRGREPFAVSATTPAIIYNGTQEVQLDYVITNVEQYSVTEVMVEIDAPPFASFIGTRGELWGASRDKYTFETTEFLPGESQTVSLIARFDTSVAPDITTLQLADYIRIRYITCWEANAYNPEEYIQTLYPGNTTAIAMNQSTTIQNIPEQITYIYNQINITRDELNQTITDIWYIVYNINDTITYINNTWFPDINSTLSDIAINISIQINDSTCTQYDCSAGVNNAPNGSLCYMLCDVNQEVDCDSSVASPGDLCDRVDQINNTLINDINNTLNNILYQVTNLNFSEANITLGVDIDFSAVLGNISELYNLTEGGFSAVDGNLSFINETVTQMLELMNCSGTPPPETICDLLNNLTSHTEVINMTTWDNYYFLEHLVNEVWGNLTAQDLLNNITITSTSTTDILREITQLREFDEELVFLVTDSFNSQAAARADVEDGDLDSAMSNLREANSKLVEASERLVVVNQQVAQQDAAQRTKWIGATTGIIAAIVAALILVLFVYYKRQKTKNQKQEEQ